MARKERKEEELKTVGSDWKQLKAVGSGWKQ
jgi:hypothetical protein